MKKIFFFELMVLTLLLSCKENETDYTELIVGKWLYTQMNSQLILTDESSYCEYCADGSEIYANGFQLDENNKTWIESKQFNYQVIDNIIAIEGIDENGKQNDIELKIQSIDDNQTTQTTKKCLIDNIDYPDSNTYTYDRITNDLSSQFVGVWYGKCTTQETKDTSYHYWEYFSDWSFNYYYQDDQDHWIKKSDNEGRFFLYGNLFVGNYSNDLVSGGKGKTFECWNFEIDGNNMTWNAIRKNNSIESYQMTKVDNPPQIN